MGLNFNSISSYLLFKTWIRDIDSRRVLLWLYFQTNQRMPFNPALPPSHRPPPPRYVPPSMSQPGQIRPSMSMPATYWGHDPSDNCKLSIECTINGTLISRCYLILCSWIRWPICVNVLKSLLIFKVKVIM